jgi:hypothetical protein
VLLLFQIAVVITVIVVLVIFGSQDLCPSCGTQLAEQFGEPGARADSCACGWSRRP